MKKENLIVLIVMVLSLAVLGFMGESEHISNRADKEVVEVSVDTAIVKNKEVKVIVKDFNMYKDSLAWSESRGNYKIVNEYGYLGKYQFGKAALKDLGLNKISKTEFLNNKDLQEKAFVGLLSINKYRLRKYDEYIGSTINGIEVTESGMLAAAHLVGAKSVRKWLKSNGKRNRADANGTTVEHYMKRFGGYDVSNIVAKRKVKIK